MLQKIQRLSLVVLVLLVWVGTTGCDRDCCPDRDCCSVPTWGPTGPDSTPTPTPMPVCTYAVQETPQEFTYQGGNGGFSVSTSPSNCSWTAVANVGWVAVTSGFSGIGNGTVNYLVAGNGGPARTGTISVADKTVTVRQAGS